MSAENSHCRYRFSLEFELISIINTDFGVKLIHSVMISATRVQDARTLELICKPLEA